jgi:ADP-heptose:LPS heptosyltransferase
LLRGIGDVLIALSAIQVLARSHSQAQMTLLTFPLPPAGKLLESDPVITYVVYAERNNPRKSVETLLAS